MDVEIPLHIKPTSDESVIKYQLKATPLSSRIPVPFAYAASDDGTDENLLILLHGLGEQYCNCDT